MLFGLLTSLLLQKQFSDLGGMPPPLLPSASMTHFYMDYYSLADPAGMEG